MVDDTRIIRERFFDQTRGQPKSVYKKKPRFSIFGGGCRVEGGDFRMYKRIQFSMVPPLDGKPAMVDDTPCKNQDEAVLRAELLNSKAAREFLRAFIFWDAKRPITAQILKRLDLLALAKMQHKTLSRSRADAEISASQFALF